MDDEVLYHLTSLSMYAIIIKSDNNLYDVKKSNDPMESVFHVEKLMEAYKERNGITA